LSKHYKLVRCSHWEKSSKALSFSYISPCNRKSANLRTLINGLICGPSENVTFGGFVICGPSLSVICGHKTSRKFANTYFFPYKIKHIMLDLNKKGLHRRLQGLFRGRFLQYFVESFGFAIFGLANLRNMRICHSRMSLRICGFAIIGLEKKFACQHLTVCLKVRI
jgi:hypothetical protein